LKYLRFLTYLGDKETPGFIRTIIPYMLLNKYNNILAVYDFIMSNSSIYFEGLHALQVQRIATKDQYDVIKFIKKNLAPKYGFKIFYDIDDLITDIPTFNSTHKYYKDNQENIKKILETVDCIVCSTAKLAGFLGKYNKTKVVQNRLFEAIWKQQKHTSFFETGKKPKIIWSGSITHFSKDKAHDFDSKIIEYIVETTNKFDWIFFGHRPKELEIPGIIFQPWNKVYFDYPNDLRRLDPDIGIALLQTNDFNKCKSNLKAMEYVSLGIPGVYSKITPYQYMTCRISTPDQFIEGIEKLTTDQNYYEKVRKKDSAILSGNLYWDDTYIKKYIDTYLQKNKKKK
jgi:hypothetical protein